MRTEADVHRLSSSISHTSQANKEFVFDDRWYSEQDEV